MSTPTLTVVQRVSQARGRLLPLWGARTPGRLRIALGTSWLLALFFFVAVWVGVREHRRVLQTIGKDTAPSIIAAQGIKASLADMHSNAANVLLHAPGKGTDAARDYEKRRLEATEGILAAAANITYGEAERGPLRRLLNGLGTYEEEVAQARVLHERGEAGFLARHASADRTMKDLLREADSLDRANREALDRGYDVVRLSSWLTLAGVLAAGGALIGVLVGTQLFLYHRMKRVVNPGLAAATALAASFLVYALILLVSEGQRLRTAKEEAFESIHELWRARADAYDANGDESRWLLDRERADAYEKDFLDKTARLIDPLPEGQAYQDLLATVARGGKPQGYKGYLAAELGNITFTGEKEAAVECLKTLVQYVAIDRRIRQLENQGRHEEALALCIGEKPGESNWAFAQFDSALGKTITINQEEFDRAVDQGFAALQPLDWAAPLLALGVGLLALLGLLPRLREYAGS